MSGSLVAEYINMFASYSCWLCLSSVWCWGGSTQWVYQSFLKLETAACCTWNQVLGERWNLTKAYVYSKKLYGRYRHRLINFVAQLGEQKGWRDETTMTTATSHSVKCLNKSAVVGVWDVSPSREAGAKGHRCCCHGNRWLHSMSKEKCYYCQMLLSPPRICTPRLSSHW